MRQTLGQVLPVGLALGAVLGASGCVSFFGTKNTETADVWHESAMPEVQQVGNHQAVLSSFERGRWLEIRSSSNNPHHRLYSTLGAGEPEVAEREARDLLAESPKDLAALTVLAASLAMMKKYDLAAYYARLIERHYPGHADSYNLQGLAIIMAPNRKTSDYRNAIAAFNKAFEQPNQIASGMNLGHLYLELGNANEASRVFQIVSQRCGQCVDSMIGFGIAERRLGRKTTAAAAFHQVLKQNPKNTEALYHLALVYKNGYNDKSKATKYLEQVLAAKARNGTEASLRDRARVVLRAMKAENEDRGPRSAVAEDAPESNLVPASVVD